MFPKYLDILTSLFVYASWNDFGCIMVFYGDLAASRVYIAMIVLFPSFQVLLGPVLTSDETVGNNIHTFEENIPPAISLAHPLQLTIFIEYGTSLMFREPNGIKLKHHSTKQLSCNCWQLVPTWYAMPNKSE